jgi:hypothetical protein
LFFVEFCDVPTLAIDHPQGELAKCEWLHVREESRKNIKNPTQNNFVNALPWHLTIDQFLELQDHIIYLTDIDFVGCCWGRQEETCSDFQSMLRFGASTTHSSAYSSGSYGPGRW